MTEISQELAQRMADLVRMMNEWSPKHVPIMGDVLRAHAEARAIAAELPVPVHPDVLEARKICAVVYPDSAEQYLSGLNDTFPLMRAALAGIRRGKELAPVNLGGGGI